MKYACQYAIVRFLPFVETGEFANVGIVLLCPEKGYFGFQFLTRASRIKAFFDQLSVKIYREARNNLCTELSRLKKDISNIKGKDKSFFLAVFQELIRDREVIFRFGDARIVLTDSPEEKLEDLFDYYVERNFVTSNYIEKNLDKNIRNILSDMKVTELYKQEKISEKGVRATFPFVYRDTEDHLKKIIKPLHLSHPDPNSVLQAGWTWYGRIKKLRDILPDDVLIAADSPSEEDEDALAVFQEIKYNFDSLDVQFAEVSDISKIKEFAEIIQ